MTRSRALAWCFAIAASAWSPRAEAYCRTTSCENDEVGAKCVPAQPKDCGIPLYWPVPCVGATVQEDGSSDVSAEATRGILKRAIATWMNADCGGGAHPRIAITDQGFVACDQQEYNQQGANSNTLIFRDDDWPYAANRLAVTTVTYNLDTGEIRDADVEFNSKSAAFTTEDANVDVDLESVVTHEMGHFLGLAHSASAEATMFADYPPESITLRSLDPDDVAGICAIYPPGEITTCDPTPRGGLGDECGSPATETPDSGCNCTTAGTSRASSQAVALCVLVFALRRRRASRL
jgi:MYXO-CTERM domain-containing protein